MGRGSLLGWETGENRVKILLFISLVALTSCQSALTVLDGATHAKGTVHVEGSFTDSEADVDLCKVPKEYTVGLAIEYCKD